MTIFELHNNVLQLDETQIISLIEENKRELKLLFINLSSDETTTQLLVEILLRLSNLALSTHAKNTDEIQFLYIELALYFKRNNIHGSVVACSHVINDSVLKNRLKAWIQYKLYANINSHVNRFKEYLKKLSSAVSDGIEDYENEVLRDLSVYYTYATALLKKHGEVDLLKQFKDNFSDSALADEYPILHSYELNKFQFSSTIEIHKLSSKIFQPSLFTEALFMEKFGSYIRTHKKTIWYEILLGYDSSVIRSEIINFGQANFDEGYEHLNPSDVVKLYSHFNMRKHYYSSLSLFERFEELEKYYNSNGVVKFIDVGCGPATSGIALIDYLSTINTTPISFDYFGVDYYKSMRDEAKYFMDNPNYICQLHEEYLSNLKDFNFDWLKNANSIFINTCYLFASDTLDEKELANSIQNIQKSNPNVPCYLLFQNTTNPTKNRKYYSFKKLFPNFVVLLSENATIYYNNKRNTLDSSGSETVFFEILKIN